jgi:hypothetical protein
MAIFCHMVAMILARLPGTGRALCKVTRMPDPHASVRWLAHVKTILLAADIRRGIRSGIL